jgi:glycosyltransferase involved in cell wall biosynthesis
MARPLAATLATIGRFHAFDLAAQLDRRGHLAAIYSGYPRRNFRDMAVNPSRIRSFPWLQTPIGLAQRFGVMPPALLRPLDWRSHQLLDRHIARTLPDCHLLWAMSSSGLAAGRAAHRRNIAYICDRGSTHILMQDRLLREEHARHGFTFAGIDPRFIEKEQAEYAEADAVTVPSGFARDSFLRMGVPAAKLHRIPYGVDLRAFRPVRPRAGLLHGGEFRVLFVGALSLRKGLPYLLQAFGRAALGNARLVLVGAPVAETEALLARHPLANLERLGALPRARVVEEMSRAGVLVLPSIEEGLALVQAQAMACGCPVIATPHTGAVDLFADGREGFIVPVRDPEAIADRLARLHGDPELRAAMGEAALARVRTIGGWDDYGRAALALFLRLARARGHEVVADPG